MALSSVISTRNEQINSFTRSQLSLPPEVSLIWGNLAKNHVLKHLDLYCGCTGVNIEAINFLVPLEESITVGVVAGPGIVIVSNSSEY